MTYAAPVIRQLADGFAFLEGPRWHRGHLYVSDFYLRKIFRFDAQAERSVVCDMPGQPSGLGFTPDGSLLIVSMLDQKLLRLRDGQLTTHADLAPYTDFLCNDLLVDGQGRAYVGNFGWDTADGPDAVDPSTHGTQLLLVQPDGTVSVAASNLVFPNGAVLTPDGKTLLIAETFAARISAFDVGAEGSLHNRRVWASFSDRPFKSVTDAVKSGVPLPDGLTLDAEGAVWMGNAAGRGPLRVFEGGRIAERIDTGNLAVFAVALGDADRRTLYMCASPPLLSNDPSTDHSAKLLSCPVSAPGVGLP